MRTPKNLDVDSDDGDKGDINGTSGADDEYSGTVQLAGENDDGSPEGAGADAKKEEESHESSGDADFSEKSETQEPTKAEESRVSKRSGAEFRLSPSDASRDGDATLDILNTEDFSPRGIRWRYLGGPLKSSDVVMMVGTADSKMPKRGGKGYRFVEEFDGRPKPPLSQIADTVSHAISNVAKWKGFGKRKQHKAHFPGGKPKLVSCLRRPENRHWTHKQVHEYLRSLHETFTTQPTPPSTPEDLDKSLIPLMNKRRVDPILMLSANKLRHQLNLGSSNEDDIFNFLLIRKKSSDLLMKQHLVRSGQQKPPPSIDELSGQLLQLSKSTSFEEIPETRINTASFTIKSDIPCRRRSHTGIRGCCANLKKLICSSCLVPHPQNRSTTKRPPQR
ncbi:unnamed protein product [Cyprideis torosa]|uniref:Uncharacterized protein n=1 Tax=Cyprideis torosa TaxID=163714 RepID=A0A7R8WQE8_9CRUS|nr:unnamed protein product [Cyprideis torosa]CAG0902588.1 unnamed protein product [Cyprideis torosa]